MAHLVVPGSTLDDSRDALALANEPVAADAAGVVATAGIHPYHVDDNKVRPRVEGRV